jgi:hypothetical protein
MSSQETSAADRPWFYGVLREGGCYSIVAADATEARVRRALASYSSPTLVVTYDELPAIGIGETERRRWQPRAAATDSKGP